LDRVKASRVKKRTTPTGTLKIATSKNIKLPLYRGFMDGMDDLVPLPPMILSSMKSLFGKILAKPIETTKTNKCNAHSGE